ncbi:hypothetical protein U6A24_13155 [Aquimarina gracilis]|uniref:Uncharacterized protein n=1 Tax=Aquimarina gracilis TaxID=874422 RepID=A0ABU5ZX08_9FLAO|nr:hypothetical protein [Aquimarina gracilis]MEB3346418.1 hypothetical protein [Aquimarina gracilis]
MKIEEALNEIESWLFLDGVEGIAQGEYESRPCITIFLSNPEVKFMIPSEYKGYKVVIDETDQFGIQSPSAPM